MRELLLGAPNLEALALHADCIPCPQALSHFRNFRCFELTVREGKPWPGDVLVDLSFCKGLEFLKITGIEPDYNAASLHLPDLCLHHVTSPKNVQLLGWFPTGDISLAPDCRLRMDTVCSGHDLWEEHWKCAADRTWALSLSYNLLQAWPEGIHLFSSLQYSILGCLSFYEAHLATLQGIPHVRLWFEHYTTLLVSAGAWKNLEGVGRGGFDIAFSDLDAFVRGTEWFLFVCTHRRPLRLIARMHGACSPKECAAMTAVMRTIEMKTS